MKKLLAFILTLAAVLSTLRLETTAAGCEKAYDADDGGCARNVGVQL